MDKKHNIPFVKFAEKVTKYSCYEVECDCCYHDEISEDDQLLIHFHKDLEKKGWIYKTIAKNLASGEETKALLCPNCAENFKGYNPK